MPPSAVTRFKHRTVEAAARSGLPLLFVILHFIPEALVQDPVPKKLANYPSPIGSAFAAHLGARQRRADRRPGSEEAHILARACRRSADPSTASPARTLACDRGCPRTGRTRRESASSPSGRTVGSACRSLAEPSPPSPGSSRSNRRACRTGRMPAAARDITSSRVLSFLPGLPRLGNASKVAAASYNARTSRSARSGVCSKRYSAIRSRSAASLFGPPPLHLST
jgi:hypothetical protein